MSEKDQTTPIVPDDPETEASLDEKKPSSSRRQFVAGVASTLGAGVILNATAGKSAFGQTAVGEVQREIISFKLDRQDLASIGEVVTKLQVTASGVDPAQPGAFTIRNHSFNPESPGAFTIRNHNFNTQSPGAYTIRNYQFSG